MKQDVFFDAMGLVCGAYRQEALNSMKEKETKRLLPRRIVRTALLAAAIVCLLIVGVSASSAVITTPEQAEAAAERELENWKTRGLLAADFDTALEVSGITERKTEVAPPYFFHRVWYARYTIHARNGNGDYVNLAIDTKSGRIKWLSVEAEAKEGDAVLWTQLSADGEDEYRFYDNFEDIFPRELTVGDYCARLGDYWGFTGYRLAPTVDAVYGLDETAPDEELLLCDVPPKDHQDNSYLTIYFDGDQENMPMYLQVTRFPDRVCLMVGDIHMVG